MRNHEFAAAALGIAALGFASVVDLRAQQALQSPVGVSVPFSAAAGAGFVSGELRITQVTEQNGQPIAVGTLGIATDHSGAPGTAVTQVVVPVIAVRSTSTGAAMTFGGAAAAPTVPGTPAGVGPVGSAGVGTTSGGTTGGTTGVFGSAAAATSSTPGTQANCGPLRIELGPLDLAQALPGLQLQRVVVDIAAPQGSVTTVNSLLCSADAALAAAASAGTTAGTTPVTGATQPGIASGSAVGTTGTASAQGTPLQGFVAALNQVLGAL